MNSMISVFYLPTNHLINGGGFPYRLTHFTATLCPVGAVKFFPVAIYVPLYSTCGALGGTKIDQNKRKMKYIFEHLKNYSQFTYLK